MSAGAISVSSTGTTEDSTPTANPTSARPATTAASVGTQLIAVPTTKTTQFASTTFRRPNDSAGPGAARQPTKAPTGVSDEVSSCQTALCSWGRDGTKGPRLKASCWVLCRRVWRYLLAWSAEDMAAFITPHIPS